MIIAVDFDGTLCENKYPEIGKPNKKVISELKARKENGDRIILWTCRTGNKLKAAVHWCEKRGLVFDRVNENLPEIIEKYGEDCRKITATEYWDDRAVPVVFQEDKTYTVGQVANRIGVCEETVRRWIRSGKLRVTHYERRFGIVMSESEIREFLKSAPKYASRVRQ